METSPPAVYHTNEERQTATADATRQMKRILITDDNRPAADGLVRLLKALGYDARALYSGNDLLALLATDPADLALIDIGMPEMDGYQVATEIRKRGHDLPIVALTGYGQIEDKEHAAAAGFTYHLTKPVGARDLKAVIDQLLG